MRKIALLVALIALTVPAIFTTPAQAQSRAWISGIGDDVNPCSRTAPCKTFAGAFVKVQGNDREIDTLDPGGFGAVTFTSSVIVASEGTGEAGIMVAGTNGITINCANGDDPSCVVVLRGLQIDGTGPGSSSLAGVKFVSGKALIVQNCAIHNFNSGNPNGYGIAFTPDRAAQLDVSDLTIFSNGQQGAGAGTGAGILIQPAAGGSVRATVVRSSILNNSNGIRMDNTSAAAPSTLAIRDSTIAGSSGHGLAVVNPPGGTPFPDTATVDRSTISGNAGGGVVANGAGASVNLANDVIIGNGTGVRVGSGGAIDTNKTNAILGNGNDNKAVMTAVSGD